VKSFSKWSDDPKEIESAKAAMTKLYIKSRVQQEVW
jgi:hypothetical protein